MSGDHPIPKGVWDDITKLLQDRNKKISDTLDDLAKDDTPARDDMLAKMPKLR